MCVHVVSKAKRGRVVQDTDPEGLLGEIVGMATPRPQTARAETARGVVLGPRETCTEPVLARVVRAVFPCVERELLVVCYGFEREKRERC